MSSQKPDPAVSQVRLAAAVIVTAFLAWMAASVVGGRVGLPVRYAFLIDMICMAALIWALVVLFRVWQKSRDNGV
ncbi:MAG: DUF5337 family protein [Pseudomonadota bacterium]